MEAQVFAACFDSYVPPVVFVPSAFVLARVSVAVVGSAVGAAAPSAVSGPDPPVLPWPWYVLVLAAVVIVGVPVPVERAGAPAPAVAFCLNWDSLWAVALISWVSADHWGERVHLGVDHYALVEEYSSGAVCVPAEVPRCVLRVAQPVLVARCSAVVDLVAISVDFQTAAGLGDGLMARTSSFQKVRHSAVPLDSVVAAGELPPVSQRARFLPPFDVPPLGTRSALFARWTRVFPRCS